MKKIVLIIVLALVLSPLHSCKKEDDLEPTKTELLTNGIWDGVSIEDYTDDVSDYIELIPELQLDFKTDKTYISFEYGVQEYIYTWSLNSDETKLSFDDVFYTIETLTATSLVLSFTEIYEGIKYKEVITLKR